MTSLTPRVILTAAALMLGTAGTALAEDAALYDAPVPADAAFVRLLAEQGAAPAQLPFGGTLLPAADIGRDAYAAIRTAQLTGVRAGGYYSLVPNQHGVLLIEEPARETAAKVHLLLVNAGPEPVRLIVPGPQTAQSTEVVAALAPGQAASRAVNPIQVRLAVERARDGVQLAAFDLRLSRGQNLTFVAGADTARLVENRFGPVLTLK